MSGTLVIAETEGGALAPVSLEVLAAARSLDAGTVTAIVAGSGHAETLIQHGADAVIEATNAALETGMAEVFLPAVLEARESTGASIILMATTSLGRDLAPALAFSLEAAAAMDCVAVSLEGGKLRATRSCYGGNARAEVSWASDIQIATIKPKNFDALPADASRSGDTSSTDTAGEARIRVLGVEQVKAEGVRLEDAGIVISGGRGLGDPAAFADLQELAGLLRNAAVGGSRAACDLGWWPPAQQVGLTGKTVSPDLYIAIAISGASQHMAGMSSSKNIVAINRDEESNMVLASKYAIIEDYKKVLPAIIEAVKNL